MTATYQLSLDELQPGFVDQLKQMHREGQVRVTVEVIEEHDETAFLLHNPKNREILFRSKTQAEAGDLIDVNLDEFLEEV